MSAQTPVTTRTLEKSMRKQRATKSQVKTFIKWAIENDVYEHYTPGRIKQMYFDETGIDFSECCIRRQKNKWTIVDDQVVKAEEASSDNSN